MSRSARVIGVRLSGLVVRDESGGKIIVPWEHTACDPNRGLRPSGAAELVSAVDLKGVRGPKWIGQDTINRLRVRAVARTIRAGTHRRIWPKGPRIDFGSIALVSVCLIGLTAWGFFSLVSHYANEIPTGSPEYVEFWRQIDRVVYPLGICVLAALSGLPIAGWFFAGRPATVSLRTSSQGVAFILDDGREEFRDWAEFFSKRIPLARQPTRHPLLSDLAVVFDAAHLICGKRRAWRSMGERCRSALLISLGAAALIWAGFFGLFLLRSLEPPTAGAALQVTGPWSALLWSGALSTIFLVLFLASSAVFHGPRNMVRAIRRPRRGGRR